MGRLMDMGIPEPMKRYTPEEYYQLEAQADYKSDYYKGEIFAMAGGSPAHSRITANLIRETGRQLKGKPCAEYESNLRLRIQGSTLRTYPDVSVYCEALKLDPEDRSGQTALNPTVLFEVLSPTTEAYDRGLKWKSYRRIDSLKAYVLVAQDEPFVEVHERQADGTWSLREASGLDARVTISSIGVELVLGEVYDRVEFVKGEKPGPSPIRGG